MTGQFKVGPWIEGPFRPALAVWHRIPVQIVGKWANQRSLHLTTYENSSAALKFGRSSMLRQPSELPGARQAH